MMNVMVIIVIVIFMIIVILTSDIGDCDDNDYVCSDAYDDFDMMHHMII